MIYRGRAAIRCVEPVHLTDRSTGPSGNGSSPVVVENFTRQFDSTGAMRSAIRSRPWQTRQIQLVSRNNSVALFMSPSWKKNIYVAKTKFHVVECAVAWL